MLTVGSVDELLDMDRYNLPIYSTNLVIRDSEIWFEAYNQY